MFIFTIIGIIIGVVIFINYYWGCTLVVIAKLLIPPIVRFQLGPFDISFATFLVVLLFLAFILKKKYKQKYPKQFFKYFAIFIVSSFMIIPFAPVIPYATQISSNIQFIITEMLLACLMWYGITSEKQLKQFCILFLSVTILVCIYGILTYTWKTNPYMDILTLVYDPMGFALLVAEDRGVLDMRISATLPHPLSWGQFLGIIMALFILLWQNIVPLKQSVFKKIKNNSFYFFCLAIFLVNIFLTGSRSVLASVMIIIGFVFISFSSKKKIALVFVSIVGLFLLLIVPIKNSPQLDSFKANIFFWDTKAAEKAGIKGSSSEMRKDQLNSVLGLVGGGYQLFGLGKGLVEQRSNLNIRIKNIEDLYGFESIVYYKIAEQGVIGLLFFFLFYFQMYLYIRRKHMQCFHDRTGYFVDAFFVSYLISIIITGIQSTFSYFLLATFIYLRFLELKDKKCSQDIQSQV